MKVDLISDPHGRLRAVKNILAELGYIPDSEGHFYHPEGRIAFFLGDILDKGKEVYELFFFVKGMVEKGYAKMILGNHELNFIAFYLKDKNGDYLRDHSKINQIEKSKELLKHKDEVFDFLFKVPLFYEDDKFRAIHACWDQECLNLIKEYLDKDNCLNEKTYKDIYKDDKAFEALEIVLKGYEVDINPSFYHDNNGHKRTTCRYNWWEENLNYETVPSDIEIKDHLFKNMDKYNDDKFVFFGHYTKKGKPYIQSKRAMCLDFCREDYLALYQFDTEDDEFFEDKLIYVKPSWEIKDE